MKYKFKKIICILLTFTSILLLSGFDYEDRNPLDVQPRIACGACNEQCIMACQRQREYSYTTECRRSPSCDVKVYVSRGVSQCPECLRYVELYGLRECLEIHTICSLGYNEICTFGYLPPGTLP